MYQRILLAIDATPTDENRSALKRTEQIGLLTGGTVHVLHVARSHIVAGDITEGAALGVRSTADDVEIADRDVRPGSTAASPSPAPPSTSGK